jgi:hypothetical protein
MTAERAAITLDIDWAPDHVIDGIADRLIAARVRATWFVTHASPAIERLRRHPALFELGIHPNFLSGSTHGATPSDVLEHCMQLVPTARSMRTHSLVQSTVLLEAVARLTPIANDVSLYLPGQPGLEPFVQPLRSRPMTRLPFWWEDDFEMYAATADWALARRSANAGAGLCIVNFHPIHVALNSPSLARYDALKAAAPALHEAPAALVEAYRFLDGHGADTAFSDMVMWLAAHGGGRTISQLALAE